MTERAEGVAMRADDGTWN